MSKVNIYNLEFPEYVKALSIGGYKFSRVANYAEALGELQNTVQSYGGEFNRPYKTGSHQITATVELPEKEKNATLPWDKKFKHTRLHDVLFLLSLFNGKNIFEIPNGYEKYPLRPDQRGYYYGGQFQLSAHEDIKWQNIETGELITEKEMEGRQVFEYNNIDLGLEKTINEVLITISTKDWKEEFGNGYYLFLFRQALRIHDIEPVFILCWTIWEHLFALHNKKWLDNQAIEQMSADKKISFILNKYLLVDLDDAARKEIKRITQARNRLVHFGMKPDNVDHTEMELFIRLTEQVMAITLKLKPSNLFNSFEKLKEFLKSKNNRLK